MAMGLIMKNFLILGKTGVGKSSFINSVFGYAIAETASDEACTKIVSHFALTLDYGEICLIDTPGLAEEGPELDMHYLNMVKNSIKAKEIFMSVFVTPLHDTRFRPSEKFAIKSITEILGRNIWDSSWLVFTFAGLVEKERLNDVCVSKIQHFNTYLNEVLGSGFSGFKKIILIDNKINNWTDNGRPIQEFFNE